MEDLPLALVLTTHNQWEHGMVWLFKADKYQVHAAYGDAWQAAGIAEAALLALLLGAGTLSVPTLLLGAGTLSVLTLRRSLRPRHDRDRYRLTADAQSGQGACTEGKRDGSEPAVRVLDHPAPAAFCIPGSRRGSRIVVTTAALELLSGDELAAALGRTGLLRGYADEVRRLAKALLEMSAAPGSGPGGPGLPAMTGSHPAGRVHRLIGAALRPASRLLSATMLVATLAVALLPVAVAIAPAVLPADTAHLVSAGR
ncbi:hypothetical protein [Streptomyces sp. cg40]|uniref:hypothetical protein n=1 Tax=Streptomyces sp. cg40 TaxID=3419764 RepID=UPI003D0466E4